MDDRDLEARLGAHLHRRFDNARPSPQLTASVQAILRTEPRSARLLPELRVGSRRLSWSVLGAGALAAILAVAAIRMGSVLEPGDRGSGNPETPSPAFPVFPKRHFIVLAAEGASPSRADRERATQVLSDRLLGPALEGSASERTDAITFELAAAGPSDEFVRNVLSATGDVQFVPLPPEDYDQSGDGPLVAVPGEPLPKDAPALFGWDGIASVGISRDADDRPILSFTLTPDGRAAFADYTAAHVTETMAIVIDGRVALLSVINESIAGGEVQMNGGGLPGSDEAEQFDEASAILVGGRLPESWGQPRVPQVISREQAAAGAQREWPEAIVVSVELRADEVGEPGHVEAVWRITLDGEFPTSCGTGASPGACIRSELVSTVDATTGERISVEPT